MIVSGVIGGSVYYFSDANLVASPKNKERKIKVRKWGVCILLGFAATLTVPFFLKLADSNLIENIYLSAECTNTTPCKEEVSVNVEVVAKKDSAGKLLTDTIKNATDSLKTNPKLENNEGKEKNRNAARDYLLWASYCLLAAAAGMRFIDFLINKMITAEKVKETTAENKQLREDKEKQEKTNKKRLANTKLQQAIAFQQEVDAADNEPEIREFGKREIVGAVRFTPSDLPPITNADDPQKGRFGGVSNKNGRTLSVEYESYPLPLFLNIKIKVSANEGSPKLNGEVYLFLHDSFAKSVVLLNANDVEYVEYSVPSYGAFTIGAVCDYGQTLLELDLAQVDSLPEDFRKR